MIGQLTYHILQVNDVHTVQAFFSTVPSKHNRSPVVYGGEREASTWWRPLSSGGRRVPCVCSVGNGTSQ